jgi:hypothetical protein
LTYCRKSAGGSDDVSPLRRNRTYCAVVEPQQQAPAGRVASLADADGGPTSERMKGVSYEDMMLASEGNGCILE